MWIAATLVAALAQTARNATQSSLTTALGTLGATQVRFVYGLPFALAFLSIVALAAGTGVPAPTAKFVVLTTGGAVAQIFGTALLLATMRARSFSVATAFTKTEAVQVALFGLVLLDEHLTLARAAAIAIATSGVVLVAVKPGETWDVRAFRPALSGVASGGFFALAAVGFRGGILALNDGPFFIRATTTLVWSLGIQASLLGSWMALFARPALIRSLQLWRQSLTAGFLGAFASQFWFLGFSLTTAVNVRTLALVEVLFAQVVSRSVFRQRVAAREAVGMAMLLAGVALLLAAT